MTFSDKDDTVIISPQSKLSTSDHDSLHVYLVQALHSVMSSPLPLCKRDLNRLTKVQGPIRILFAQQIGGQGSLNSFASIAPLFKQVVFLPSIFLDILHGQL